MPQSFSSYGASADSYTSELPGRRLCRSTSPEAVKKRFGARTRVDADPKDGNLDNDRLPGYGCNAFLGPDYATTDLRLSRIVRLGSRRKLELMVESFNLLNRTNLRPTTTDQGFYNTAAQFVPVDNRIGISYFPGSYRQSATFLRATDAYAPRQVQLALRVTF